MRVYLDNCCFNRPYDDQSQLTIELETQAKLSLQDKVLAGDLELVWSYILDYENNANPFAERRENIAIWKGIATQHILESERLYSMAEKFLEIGLRDKDALHVASAIEAGSERFFTTDKGILKKRSLIEEIAICNPVDYFTSGDD